MSDAAEGSEPSGRRGLRLCSIGNLVHDPASNGLQDLETYRSLSQHLGRVYVVVRSPRQRDLLIRSGNVVIIALAARRGLLLGRLEFLVGALRTGLRLNRRAGIHVYAASDPLVSGIAGLALRTLTGTPLLVHLQGQLLDLPRRGMSPLRSWTVSRLSRSICRRADMVRCVSQSVMNTAAQSGVRPSRLAYLPSRVDTTRFSPAKRAALAPVARSELDRAEGKIVLFAGTLSRTKGVDDLVQAVPKIAIRHPDVTLVLVGSGPLGTRLRQLARQLGVANKVLFVGRTSHDEMPRHMASADVLVLPSLNEGLPRVILEAMASGLPVVATSVGGVPELVEDGRTGLLVPPADHAALADAICRVLDDPKKAQAWGQAGREVVERQHEREANIREYARLVESVASAGRNRP
jgi:glycosyltransferase involved in cell wall biosynthesis